MSIFRKYKILQFILAGLVICMLGMGIWTGNLFTQVSSLETELVVSRETMQVLRNKVTDLESQLVTYQEELATLEGQYSYLEGRNAYLGDRIAVLEGEIAALEEKLEGVLPYSKASGDLIKLLNNFEGTHNPTWQELRAFLITDGTDDHRYSYFSFVCGDFAEMLHNNAEQSGIRAAVVIVFFQSGIPHALNAFYTSDRGLVYVDCTGEGLRGVTFESWQYETVHPIEWDKIAYMVVGKEYGTVSVDVATSPGYSFYEDYINRWNKYDVRVTIYNQEVDQYTQELGERYFLEEPEYSYFLDWYNRLEAERLELERVAEGLGYWCWEPFGVVSGIEIYW